MTLDISRAGEVLATHPRLKNRRERSVLKEHFDGLKAYREAGTEVTTRSEDLLRPLEEYESVVGGSW